MIPLLLIPTIIKKLFHKYPKNKDKLYSGIFYFFLILKIGIIIVEVQLTIFNNSTLFPELELKKFYEIHTFTFILIFFL